MEKKEIQNFTIIRIITKARKHKRKGVGGTNCIKGHVSMYIFHSRTKSFSAITTWKHVQDIVDDISLMLFFYSNAICSCWWNKKKMEKKKALSCVVVIQRQIKQTNAFCFESASDDFYFFFLLFFKRKFLKENF